MKMFMSVFIFFISIINSLNGGNNITRIDGSRFCDGIPRISYNQRVQLPDELTIKKYFKEFLNQESRSKELLIAQRVAPKIANQVLSRREVGEALLQETVVPCGYDRDSFYYAANHLIEEAIHRNLDSSPK